MFSINLSMPVSVHRTALVNLRQFKFGTPSFCVTVSVWTPMSLQCYLTCGERASLFLPHWAQASLWSGRMQLHAPKYNTTSAWTPTEQKVNNSMDKKGSWEQCVMYIYFLVLYFFPLRVQNKTSILCVPLFIKKKLILLYKLSTFHKKVNHYEQCKTKNPLLPSS